MVKKKTNKENKYKLVNNCQLRSKKTKRLQLNASIFSQFSNFGLNFPNAFSEIPSVIAQLNDYLVSGIGHTCILNFYKVRM